MSRRNADFLLHTASATFLLHTASAVTFLLHTASATFLLHTAYGQNKNTASYFPWGKNIAIAKVRQLKCNEIQSSIIAIAISCSK